MHILRCCEELCNYCFVQLCIRTLFPLVYTTLELICWKGEKEILVEIILCINVRIKLRLMLLFGDRLFRTKKEDKIKLLINWILLLIWCPYIYTHTDICLCIELNNDCITVSSVPWQLDGAFLCELVKYHRRECAMCVIWVEGPSPWQHVNGIRGRPIVRLCRKFPRTSLGYCHSSPRCCWWVESAIHRSEKPRWGCFSVFISHSLMEIINQCQWGQTIKPVFM